MPADGSGHKFVTERLHQALVEAKVKNLDFERADETLRPTLY